MTNGNRNAGGRLENAVKVKRQREKKKQEKEKKMV